MPQFWLAIDGILFGHDNIGCEFQNGDSLKQLCSDLLRGNVRMTSLRQIEVARVEGQWVAVNGNRRLYVLKKLLSRGKLHSPLIPVKELPGTGDRDIVPITLSNLRVRRGRNMWKELDDVIDGIVVMPDSNLGSSQYRRLPADPHRTDRRRKRHDIETADAPVPGVDVEMRPGYNYFEDDLEDW